MLAWLSLVRGADLHMAQWIPLPLTVSSSSKIQIGFTFLVPAHPDSPWQRAVKRMCVCVLYNILEWDSTAHKISTNFSISLCVVSVKLDIFSTTFYEIVHFPHELSWSPPITYHNQGNNPKTQAHLKYAWKNGCMQIAFNALTLLVEHYEDHPANRNSVMRCRRRSVCGTRCRLFADTTVIPKRHHLLPQ